MRLKNRDTSESDDNAAIPGHRTTTQASIMFSTENGKNKLLRRLRDLSSTGKTLAFFCRIFIVIKIKILSKFRIPHEQPRFTVD